MIPDCDKLFLGLHCTLDMGLTATFLICNCSFVGKQSLTALQTKIFIFWGILRFHKTRQKPEWSLRSCSSLSSCNALHALLTESWINRVYEYEIIWPEEQTKNIKSIEIEIKRISGDLLVHNGKAEQNKINGLSPHAILRNDSISIPLHNENEEILDYNNLAGARCSGCLFILVVVPPINTFNLFFYQSIYVKKIKFLKVNMKVLKSKKKRKIKK